MGIVIIDQHQHIVVDCNYCEDIGNAVEVSQAFCKAMAIGSVVIHHNNLIIQVTARGVPVYNRNWVAKGVVCEQA